MFAPKAASLYACRCCPSGDQKIAPGITFRRVAWYSWYNVYVTPIAIAITSASPPPAPASAPPPPPSTKDGRLAQCDNHVPDYGWRCYLDNYSDLKRVYGSNTASAREHFVNYGYSEGRSCACTSMWSPHGCHRNEASGVFYHKALTEPPRLGSYKAHCSGSQECICSAQEWDKDAGPTVRKKVNGKWQPGAYPMCQRERNSWFGRVQEDYKLTVYGSLEFCAIICFNIAAAYLHPWLATNNKLDDLEKDRFKSKYAHQCAAEGEICECPNRATVFYGRLYNKGKEITMLHEMQIAGQTLSKSKKCLGKYCKYRCHHHSGSKAGAVLANKFHGNDPARGNHKQCICLPRGEVYPIGNDGAVVSCEKGGIIVYGAKHAVGNSGIEASLEQVKKQPHVWMVPKQGKCNGHTCEIRCRHSPGVNVYPQFGGCSYGKTKWSRKNPCIDPLPGRYKRCWCVPGNTGEARFCADEGQNCVCPHGGLIVYGQRWSNGVGRRNQHADEFQDGRLSYEDMTALNHETKGPLDWNNARCQTGDRHCHHPCSFSTSYASYNRFSGDPVPGKLKQCYCVPFPEQSDLRKLRLK